MSNYPPGTSAGDPRAPWNDTPAPECDECGGVYAEGGHEPLDDAPKLCHDCGHEGFDCGDWDPEHGLEVCPECGSEDIQNLPCPNAGMNGADLKEAERADAAEQRMERMREEGRR